MNTKQRIIAICFLAVSLLAVSMTISSCGSGQLFVPTLSPTPTYPHTNVGHWLNPGVADGWHDLALCA